MGAEELDDLTIGITEIDDQHRAFLRAIVALREAVAEGIGARDRLLRTLQYLDEFVAVHFSTEERYMRLHNYPGILLHEKEHAEFARAYAELKQRFHDLDAQGELTALHAIEVEHRLENWLTGHILRADKKLGAFLSERM